MFYSSIYSRMKQIHAFNARKSGENSYITVALRSHFSEYLQMFVRVSESHCRFMKRIFYIENILIVRKIIIKNPSGSNDYIFFSIIYGAKSLVFFGFRQFIRYNKSRL